MTHGNFLSQNYTENLKERGGWHDSCITNVAKKQRSQFSCPGIHFVLFWVFFPSETPNTFLMLWRDEQAEGSGLSRWIEHCKPELNFAARWGRHAQNRSRPNCILLSQLCLLLSPVFFSQYHFFLIVYFKLKSHCTNYRTWYDHMRRSPSFPTDDVWRTLLDDVCNCIPKPEVRNFNGLGCFPIGRDVER